MKNYVLIIIVLLAGTLLLAQEKETPFYAADQSVFLLPTAHTMPRGTHALTSFEVLLLQYSFSATDRLHLSAGMVFPVTADMFKTLSLGAKYRYLSQGKVNSAAWASYSPDPQLFTAGNVVSLDANKASLHFAAALYANAEEGESRILFGLGGIAELSHRVNLMGEIIMVPETEWIEEEDIDEVTGYEGLLIVGLRFKGEKISWDLGGARSLEEGQGDLIAIPFLKATFLF